MSDPILPYALWESGTNSNSLPANDNSRRNAIFHGLIISAAITAQPASPADGDIYIMTAAPTGAQWATFDQFDLAIYYGGTWTAFAPVEGPVFNLDGALVTWNGSAYVGAGTGAAVASIGVQYEADTGSTADSDPGPGLLKWNNATQPSATFLYLDDATVDGVSLTAWWAAIDAGGFAYLQHATDQDVWQIWEVTSLVDATGYVKLGVALLAAGAPFADGAPMLVTLEQGAVAGAGDVVGPGSSTTDHFAQFASGTGKVLKDGGWTPDTLIRNPITSAGTSGALAINAALGDYFTAALNGNVSGITFSNLPGAGKGVTLMLLITQDSTPRTFAWPASFKWAGGTVPAISTASGAKDLLAITSYDNGTTWNATLAKGYA